MFKEAVALFVLGILQLALKCSKITNIEIENLRQSIAYTDGIAAESRLHIYNYFFAIGDHNSLDLRERISLVPQPHNLILGEKLATCS